MTLASLAALRDLDRHGIGILAAMNIEIEEAQFEVVRDADRSLARGP